MINFTSLSQTVTAAVGSLLISTAFIAAAVGPAHVGAPTQVAASTSAQANA